MNVREIREYIREIQDDHDAEMRHLLERIEELEVALKRIYREADDGLPYPILALNNIAFIAVRALAEKEGVS